MTLTVKQKDQIYDYIVDNKSKFIYKKSESERVKKLNDIISEKLHIIEFDSLSECFLVLTKHWDKKCKNKDCNNNRKITSLFPNRKDFLEVKQKYGIYKFCENVECNYKSISERQLGDNNTSHRMTKETLNSMRKKNSINMKRLIREGKFIPNITNSWSNSRCEISFIRNNKTINMKTRSTWEAYFQLYNKDLLYEKIVIPYKYKGEEHNYIIDFVDYKNNILYEVKPLSNKNDNKVKVKIKYAKKWCKLNGYKFILITDKWFLKHYNEDLVKNQPSEKKILKNLKQFKNEN
jgi:hypothetical protein